MEVDNDLHSSGFQRLIILANLLVESTHGRLGYVGCNLMLMFIMAIIAILVMADSLGGKEAWLAILLGAHLLGRPAVGSGWTPLPRDGARPAVGPAAG
jgi:hypothetical protein